MGRNPKPEVTKRKDRSPRANRKVEPISTGSLLSFPNDMTPEGKELYGKLSAQGAEDNLLKLVDSPLLVLYCETWAKWKQAMGASQQLVFKAKTGQPAVNPNIWIASALSKTLIKTAEQLGMSPIGRAKMAIEIDENDDDMQAYVAKMLARMSGKQDSSKKAKKGK